MDALFWICITAVPPAPCVRFPLSPHRASTWVYHYVCVFPPCRHPSGGGFVVWNYPSSSPAQEVTPLTTGRAPSGHGKAIVSVSGRHPVETMLLTS